MATLDWSPTNNLAQFLSQNLSAGGIGTTFQFIDNPPPLGTITDTGNFGAILDNQVTRVNSSSPADIYGGIIGEHLRWNIGLGKNPTQGNSTLIITFAQPVTLATPLTFLDVDRNGERDIDPATGIPRVFQDQITVTALNRNAPVPLTGSAVGNFTRVTNTGNSVIAAGIVENSFPNSNQANVQITPSGAVTQIRVFYEPGQEYGAPGQDETIGLTQINICAPTGSIGDTVFNDLNANNIQDPGEPGIGNVPLNVIDSNGNVVGTTTTNSNGNYNFPNLLAGQYRVAVTNPPTGFAPTLTQPNPITLDPGQNFDQADFGFNQQAQGTGTIGDFVFSDNNGNGVADPGEPGLPNLNLVLRDTNGNVITTTQTDENGIYRFIDVPAGNYTVAVSNPPAGTCW